MNLEQMIRVHFGTKRQCAKKVGVSNQTIQNWVHRNPRGALRWIPELVNTSDLTADIILQAVLLSSNFNYNKPC